MAVQKLIDYLNQNHVPFTTMRHPRTYTAQETAASAHIKGKLMVKTVIMKLDGEMVMAVLPAPYRVDFQRVKQFTGAKQVELADEKEMEEACPDCTVGAVPPFGNLYKMQVIVDQDLAEDDNITFDAGSHVELLQMSFKDYSKLVQPKLADIHQHHRQYRF